MKDSVSGECATIVQEVVRYEGIMMSQFICCERMCRERDVMLLGLQCAVKMM